MRDYEVVYIFRPELESDDVDDRLESHHDRLDGEITAVEHWGQRELAFEIDGERRGYYVVAQFRAEPATLDEFEQALELDEDLVRHLLVVSEGELPVPPSQRQGEEEDEEEEEEEADEEETGDEASGDEDEEEEDEDDGEDGDEEAGDAEDEVDEDEASPEDEEDVDEGDGEEDRDDAGDGGDGDEDDEGDAAEEEPTDEPDDEER